MKLIKYLILLVGFMTLSTSCEEELDLTNEQQVIEAALWIPSELNEYQYGNLKRSFKTDPKLRAVWVYPGEFYDSIKNEANLYHLKKERDEACFIEEATDLRSKLELNEAGKLHYKGCEVFAIEAVLYDERNSEWVLNGKYYDLSVCINYAQIELEEYNEDVRVEIEQLASNLNLPIEWVDVHPVGIIGAYVIVPLESGYKASNKVVDYFGKNLKKYFRVTQSAIISMHEE